jgi:hypothetical protein
MRLTLNDFKYYFIGMIALILLCSELIHADEDSAHGLIVRGTLSHQDGTSIKNKEIYFFAVYHVGDGNQLSAQTRFQNGRMANPFGATDDNGLFNIKIPSDFIIKAESELFSVGIIRGFGPGFTIVRNLEGAAMTIEIDPHKFNADKSTKIIDVGKIILE